MKIKISNLFSLMLMAASMFLFLGGCQRDDEKLSDPKIEKLTENRNLNRNFLIDLNDKIPHRIKTSKLYQNELSDFFNELNNSQVFEWGDDESKYYGNPFGAMSILSKTINNEKIVKLPIYDRVKRKITSFYTIHKKGPNVFYFEFVDRDINNFNLVRFPNDKVLMDNDRIFNFFDFGVFVQNTILTTGAEGNVIEIMESGCITGTGSIDVLIPHECNSECSGCYCDSPPVSATLNYVTYGPCPPTSGGSGTVGTGGSGGGGYGGGGGSTGSGSSSTANSVDRAKDLHRAMLSDPTYLEFMRLKGSSSLHDIVSNFPSGRRYLTYLDLIRAYLDIKNEQVKNPNIAPLAAYLLKKGAEFGAGAVIDFSLQLLMEYWMGDFTDFASAWNAADINELQVLSSGLEAIITNKYVSIGASIVVDLTDYLKTTKASDITPAGVLQRLSLAAFSGYIGNNAAAYVGQIGTYMVKYGPQKPFQKLQDLGISPFFFILKDFRELVIEKAWANPSWVGRGRALETISSYGRYKNMTWVNSGGEAGGPLDFILGNFGVQLKTTASFSTNLAESGLNQIKKAIDAGTISSGRLDIMMPSSQSGNFANIKTQIENLISQNYSNYNILVDIGSFIE